MEESSSVNVVKFAQARAGEIASLMNDVNHIKKGNAAQSLPPHMRRRAASQNPKRIPRKLREQYVKYNAASKAKKAPKKIRKQQQRKKHEKQAKNYPAEYASRSRPGELWLGTHIWHAKRCKMDTLWGYKLPMCCHDKKLRGTHQAATKHAMLQDLSYFCCISLEGPEHKLLESLSSLTDPDSGSNFSSASYLDGTREGHTFVYHPFTFPYEAIGPVTFIWKPDTTSGPDTQKSLRNLWIWCHPSFHDELVEVLIELFKFEEIKKDNSNDEGNILFSSKVNFEKVKKHYFNEKSFVNGDVLMTLLKDKLVRHRIIGPNAQSAVTNSLELANVEDSSQFIGTDSTSKINLCDENLPVDTKIANDHDTKSNSKNTGDDECYPATKRLKLESEECDEITKRAKCNTNMKKDADRFSELFANYTINEMIALEHNTDSSITQMREEPYLWEGTDQQQCISGNHCWWKEYYSNQQAMSMHRKRKKLLEHLRNSRSGYYISPGAVIGLTVRDPRLILSRNKEKFISTQDGEDLRDVVDLLNQDVADSPIWNSSIRDEVTATQISESEINYERSKYVIPSESTGLGDRESRVPILLIHQPGTNGFGSGWDIIAPLGWSMAFWIPLVLNGGRVTGLRDLHFVNLEIGRASYPLSYPDTKAGETCEERQRVEELTTYYKRPKAKRANFATFGTLNPYFMPWTVLVQDWVQELHSSENKILFPLSTSTVDPNAKMSESVAKDSFSFFVLRQKEVRLLQNLCDRLGRLPRGSKGIKELENLKVLYNELAISALNSKSELRYSLVLIRTKCLSRGCPSVHSGIYALEESDFKEVKFSPNFLGPKEPNHKHGDRSLSSDCKISEKSESQTSSQNKIDSKIQISSQSQTDSETKSENQISSQSQVDSKTYSESQTSLQNKIDSKTQISSQSLTDSITKTENQISSESQGNSKTQISSQSQADSKTKSKSQIDSKDLEKPHIETLKSVSSRKMIGYLSEGGFSSIVGKGCGTGHCSLIGLLCVIRDCIEHQQRPVVLVREQHSFQYRVSSFEIVSNYL